MTELMTDSDRYEELAAASRRVIRMWDTNELAPAVNTLRETLEFHGHDEGEDDDQPFFDNLGSTQDAGVAGQQALLDEGDTEDRFLACRKCGADLGKDGGNGVNELCTLLGSNAGDVLYRDGVIEFDSGGYTEVFYDTYTTTGFQCPQCHNEAKTLRGLVEWRVSE